MIDMLKRHEIQVLRRVGHGQADVARLAGVSLGSVRRVEREADVTQIDNEQERARREVGRPSKAERYRPFVTELVANEPALDRKSTRLNSSHIQKSRMPSSA